MPPLSVGNLTVSASAPIDFGLSPCGAPSPALPVTLANDETSSPIHWTATVDGPFVIEGPSSGTLSSHTSTKLAVRAAVPSTAIAAVPVTGTLHVDSDDPAHPNVTVPLQAIAQGAMLRLPAFPVELGDVPVASTSYPVAANLVNDGNLPAAITFGAPSDPQFTVESKGFQLPPGLNGDVVLRFAPKVAGDANGSLPLIVQGPVCGAQAPLPLHGKGIKGIVLASPGSLDFGLVDCGDKAGSKSVLVKNVGDMAFFLSASLAQGVNFTLSPSNASVPPGETVALVVKPSAIPQTSAVTPDLYGDTLTITTSAQDDLPHVIPIHETARGMILSVNAPSPIRGLVDTLKTVPVTLVNGGNVVVQNLELGTVNDEARIAPTTLAPSSSTPATLEVRPDPQRLGNTQSHPFSTLQMTSSVANCGTIPMPPVVTPYDLALDVSADGSRGTKLVLGHTKRVYLSTNGAPYALVGGGADELSGGGGIWLRSGLSLSFLDPYTQALSYYGLPSTWVALIKPGTERHWCATEVNGDLWCVGENDGQWGNGQYGVSTSSPVAAFPSIRPISDYSASRSVGFVVHAGEVWGSGLNINYALGNSTIPGDETTLVPLRVEGLSDAVRVSAGFDGGCALRSTGQVTCWGSGSPAQQPIAGIFSAVDLVAEGPWSGCAVVGSMVQCWGWQTPTYSVSILNPKMLVSNLYGQVCAIEQGNQLSCWSTSGGQPKRELGFEGP